MELIMNIVWIISGIITVIATTYTIYYFIRDYIFEKQVALPKDYITEYDMFNNGNRIVRKTRATIKQRGRKIKGYEILQRLDQRWKLEGKVLEKSKISGHFESKSMRHTAYGNIFLEICKDNVLRGNWLGYEGVNNIINKGYYNLYPLMNNIVIKEMETDHIAYVIDIAEHTYGKGVVLKKTLLHYIENDDLVALIATKKDKKTHQERYYGFLLASRKSLDDFKKQADIDIDKLPDVVTVNDTIGYIDYLAVHQAFQNRGIGTKLLNNFEKSMKDLDTNVLLATVSKKNDRIPLETGFSMRAFKMINAIPTDENVNPGKCDYCENDTCTCNVAIFYKVS